MSSAVEAPAGRPAKPSMGVAKHAALASLWFGFNFHWLPIGFIHDVVPDHEFGRASGFLAVMNMAGGLAGVLTTSVLAGAHQLLWAYAVIGAVTVLTMIPALVASRGEGMTRI